MSTPITGSTGHHNPTVTDDANTDHTTGNAPVNGRNANAQPTPQPTPATQPTTAANHSTLGALANGAKRVGGKAVDATRNGLAKTDPVLAPTAAAGYELWAASNAIGAGSGLASTFSGANHATSAASAAANGIGMLPSALDVAATAVGFGNKAFKLADASKKAKSETPGSVEGRDASTALNQARGNLARATPGAIRDVGLGSAGLAGRIYTAAHPGHSMYGDKAASVTADGALAIPSGAMYLATGALQSAKVDRGVDRTQALRSSVLNPPSARTDSQSEAMRGLDDAFASGHLSPNVYSILRTRSDAEVQRFVDNFAALGAIGQQRLAKVLHFPGEQIAMKVLNMGRTTNLNTASMRRAAREEVIDAFISKEVRPGRTAALFDELKTVRNEALGAKTSPDVAALQRTMQDAGIDASQFSPNTLKAIAASGQQAAFVARYKALSPEEKTRLQSTLHFGSWRFWKSDATLPTTKHQRSDIRAALIKQFAGGASLDRLDAMKVRYNQKVLPLQTGRTHLQPAPVDTMRAHILAHQDNTLSTLKEEKRHAKIQVGYGVVNAAAGVAELAVNPGAAAGISATRAVLSPFYLAYAGRRGVVGEINSQNAKPVNAAMREEALLRALPQVHERIVAGGAQTSRLRHPQQFLRDELKLSDGDIRKVQTLERDGKGAEARAFLAEKNPEANVLIALRVLSEESAGLGTDGHQQNALHFIANEAAASGNGTLAAINHMSEPDATFEALKKHLVDDVSYNPAAGIDTLAHQLSSGTAIVDVGLENKARYEGQPAQDIARDLQQRFARDNPSFATRLFTADLFGGGDRAIAARNMLRDFRFSETEISQLQGMGKKDAATWLEGHLFGENLRRRFSTQMLDQGGRDAASQAVDHMPQHEADAREPLTWRHNLEGAGINVIDNAGTPGLDSMLHALYQHMSGKTDSSSSAMQRKVMDARRRVIAEVTQAQPGAHVDVTQHRDAIVRIAGQVFGKPGATVKIVNASGQGQAERVGAGRDNPRAPVAAVLCYDGQTGRTFALHGGDAERLRTRVSPKAPEVPMPALEEEGAFTRSVFADLGMSPAASTASSSMLSRSTSASSSSSSSSSSASTVSSTRTQPPADTTIHTRDDLHRFVTGGRPVGTVVETGRSDLLADQNRLFEFQGLVFRGDSRTPQQIRTDGGFRSRNDLNVPANRLEAQGLAAGKGATGQSGVSTAKQIEHALPYCNSGQRDGYVYIVDTRRLPPTEHAYDMAGITMENGYKNTDETGGEVNVTHIPNSAIVGWVSVEDADDVIDHPQGIGSIANIRDRIHLNPDYTNAQP